MSLRLSTPKTVIVASNPTPLPPSQDTQILTNVNGANIFSYPGYNYKGSNMFPGFPFAGSVNQFDISVASAVTSFEKYFGGALAPNGNMYFMPCPFGYPAGGSPLWTPNIGIYNPYTRVFDQTTLSRNNVPDLSGRLIWSAITAPNGKIYGIPWESPFVPIIDPQTNRVDTTTISTVISGTTYQNFKGGVLATNGKIYCAPGSFTDISIGVIDTVTNTFSTLAVPQPVPGAGGFGWYGGALGRNGCIYFAPHRSSGGRPLKVNPFNNTVVHCTNGPPLGSNVSAVTGKDGNVYIIPFDNSTITRIDCSGNNDLSGELYYAWGPTKPYTASSGINGQDGLIYLIPSYSNITQLTAFNIDTSGYTTLSNAFTNNFGTNELNPWYGALMGPDGKIYFIPSRYSAIASIETGIPTQQPWMLAPEFNKY
jgi:hypothetical protein